MSTKKAIGLSFLFIIISTALEYLAMFAWGPVFAVIFVAPVVEEGLRRAAVKRGFPYLFTTIFVIMEYISSMMMFNDLGIDPGSLAILRIPAIGMHFICALIQVKLHRKGGRWSKTGLVIAIILHFFFNVVMTKLIPE